MRLTLKQSLRFLAIISLISFSESANAQLNNEKKFDWSRVRVGGSFGASFGTSTFVDISPTFGYMITDLFQAGTGFTYQFLKGDFLVTNTTTGFIDIAELKMHLFGPRFYANHIIFQGLFAHVEYEALWASVATNQDGIRLPFSDDPFHSLFLGGGYSFPVAGNGAFYIMALYNILDSETDPYSEPYVIRMGFGIGF